MSELHYGPLESDAEVEGLRTVLFRSFVATDDIGVVDTWLARAGRENARCLRHRGEVAGALFVIPMGQYFGGRALGTAGIAAVGIDPQHRGRRLGHELMRRALTEFREAGYPLSTLYASTFGLYRSVGYERSGGLYEARVGLRDVGSHGRDLEVRVMTAADRAAIEELTNDWARRHPGHLERGPYVRDRIDHPTGVKAVHSWVVTEGERIVGLARWHQKHSVANAAAYDLQVLDLAARDGRVVRRLLTLFADHSSMGGELLWPSGPTDPFLLSLPERFFQLALRDLWMLRILDVRSAFEGRGWPVGAAGELHLSLTDEVLPENAGDYLVTVEGGAAQVARGGAGRLRLDVRALAPLYSGFLSADALQLLGWLEGPKEDVALATTLFAGPAPWCPDMF